MRFVMDTLIQDLRYALRGLFKSPLLALVVVASLALGIGANTTIFSLVNVLLLRPIPAHHPGELAHLYTSESDGQRYGGSSYPDYRDHRDRSTAFAALAAYSPAPMSLTVDGRSQRVLGAMVSGNYFPLLGTRAGAGRTLLPADDQEAAAPVVFVSRGLWERRFGADPSLVGRTLLVNGHALTVAGVAPAALRGAMMGITPDLFVPIAANALLNVSSDRLDHRGARWLMVLGRLKPGVSIEQAQAQADVIMRQLGREYPGPDSGRVATLVPESESRIFPRLRGPVVAFMALLMIVVGLVLLVACANVAGLLLARAAARRREIGVRLALGASRGRIVRQLLTESVALGLLGGAAGLLLAYWGTDLLLAFKPPLPFDVTLDLRPDARVLAFTLTLALATGAVFGLAPALDAAGARVAPVLADAPVRGIRRSRLRSALVVAQVAVSLLLLIGAGLTLRALSRAVRIDPGFDVDHSLAMSFDLRLHGYGETRGRAFYRDLLERVSALPHVRSVAIQQHLPLGFSSESDALAIQGYTQGGNEHLEIGCDVVSAGYFATARIPVERGREFGPGDREDAPGVAIVNQSFARRFWPGQDPIGKRISRDRSGGSGWLEVVGVARDAKYRTLSEDPRPFFYLPFSQVYGPEMTLLVRTDRDPRAMLLTVRAAAGTLDPDLPIFEVQTFAEHLGITLIPVRLASSLLGSLGLLALLLAVIGLYGVVAYAASQRTREIGIRMALGARPADVRRLIVSQGMRLALVGLALGMAAALAVTRLVANLLFGLSPLDPVTFAVIALLLLVATLVASWLPARRAARVDPMVALRHE